VTIAVEPRREAAAVFADPIVVRRWLAIAAVPVLVATYLASAYPRLNSAAPSLTPAAILLALAAGGLVAAAVINSQRFVTRDVDPTVWRSWIGVVAGGAMALGAMYVWFLAIGAVGQANRPVPTQYFCDLQRFPKHRGACVASANDLIDGFRYGTRIALLGLVATSLGAEAYDGRR
jgi:hypothetical protein